MRYARLTRPVSFDIHDSEWAVHTCPAGTIVRVGISLGGLECVWPLDRSDCSRMLAHVDLVFLSSLEMLALQAD